MSKYHQKQHPAIIILGILTLVSLVYFAALPHLSRVYGQTALPKLRDSGLGIEQLSEGLTSPTSMTFVDNSTLLVTQKNDGKVMIVDTASGVVKDRPAIEVRVNGDRERGLLGITAIQVNAIHNATAGSGAEEGATYVFLYFTESNAGEPIRNRVYRYEWNAQDQTLVNQTLMLDLPADSASIHNGGKLELDKRHNLLYAVIGNQNQAGLLQNNATGEWFPDTSVIFRVNLDGSAPKDNPFYNMTFNDDIRKYYAYGIRNSFGLAVDPVTGILWDTENGQFNYDELNVVHPGFNSGWGKIMGPISRNITTADKDGTVEFRSSLVNLAGQHYADPVFSWKDSVAPTDIAFLNSTRLGDRYASNIFVGDFKSGNLYYFQVSENRKDISFENGTQGLSDRVADNEQELSQLISGTGFGSITHIESGPDGLLYILTLGGKIYRIAPAT